VHPFLILSWRTLRFFQWSKAFVHHYSKRLVWIGGLLLCVLLWAAGCQQTVPSQSPPPTQVTILVPLEVTRVATPTPLAPTCPRGNLNQVNEIVIGALLPLSKPGALMNGFGMQTALNLAIEDVNMAGGVLGKQLRLITYDTSGIPNRGAFFAERLVREDCAAVLVGVYHNDVAMAVKKIARQYGTPVIFADPHADEITADQAPEVFRVGPTTSMLAQAPAKWLTAVGDYNQDGTKFVILIVENNSVGKNWVELAQASWPSYGLDMEPVLVDLPTTDFSPVIARVVAHDRLPDAVFIHLSKDAAFNLQRQLLDAGIGPQKKTLIINSASLTDDQAFWQQIPDGGYTIAPRIGPWSSTVSAIGTQFAQAYSQYFNHWPEAYAFEAYDTARLAADAIRRAQSLDPAKIIAALETTNIDLASGHYTFPYGSKNPPDGERVPAYLWHQWPDPPILFLQYGAVAQKANDATVIWPKVYRKIDSPLLPGLKQSP